jgi:hypothetical protein
MSRHHHHSPLLELPDGTLLRVLACLTQEER